jgi:putative MFS transporter
MPESVRFLEKKGRHEEAERIVREFEDSAGIAADAQDHAAGEDHGGAAGTARASADGPLRPAEGTARVSADAVGVVPEADRVEADGGIWSAALQARTAGLWVVWFCINLAYYGAFIWIPTLLVDRGFDLTKSFTFTLIITLAQIPGYAAAAWLIEVLGRRWTLTLFLTGSALSAVGYGMADSEAMILVAGCLLSFFNLGAWGALYAIGPELYPTAVRGTGTGAAAAFGRLASIIAPFLVPVLVVSGGQWLAFVVFALAFALAAAAAFTLPEQRGKALAE